ncbi:MAG: hypothetical protein AAF492_12050 [Verrucomicrobiota bacterium]
MSEAPARKKKSRIVGLVFCVFLLFLPEWKSQLSFLEHYLFSMIRLPVFYWMTQKGLSVEIPRLKPSRTWIVSLVIMLILVAVVEFLQTWVGRSYSLLAPVMSICGVLLAGLWAVGTIPTPEKLTRIRRETGLLLLVFLVAPIFIHLLEGWKANRRFPLVASFESSAELWRWKTRHCDIKRTRKHAAEGRYALRITTSASSLYQEVVLEELPKTWNLAGPLYIDFFNPQSDDLRVIFRMDAPRSPESAATRFQREYALPPGATRVQLTKADLSLSPGGFFFDVDDVIRLAFQLTSTPPGTQLYIDQIRFSLDDEER